MSYERMLCRISDGAQSPEDDTAPYFWDVDEDVAYEDARQAQIDAQSFDEGAAVE